MSMSMSEMSPVLQSAAALLADATARGDAASVPDRELQTLLAAAIKAYAMKLDQGEKLPAFTPADAHTATDVALAASGMLGAVEMAVFELGMWQTIKGTG